MASHKYAVVIEKGENGYGAYAPDLPGCGVAAATEAEVRELIHSAIAFHLRGLREAGDPIPEPLTKLEYVEVQLAS